MERRLPIVIGMATFDGKGREESIVKAVNSLVSQLSKGDEIRIYNNATAEINLTDNGKFYFLSKLDKPVYYFTCDDDLEYPPTYINDMVEAIERTKTIVTHHGRILMGPNRNYYRGHQAFRCLNDVNEELVIDVPGTGVTAFSTEYFNPINLWAAPQKKMSDIVFGYQAAIENKTITLLKHKAGYIKQVPLGFRDTICGQESVTSCVNQVELSNKIWNLKHT